MRALDGRLLALTDTPALPQPEILVYRAHARFGTEGRPTDGKTRGFVGKLLRGLADRTRRLRREPGEPPA